LLSLARLLPLKDSCLEAAEELSRCAPPAPPAGTSSSSSLPPSSCCLQIGIAGWQGEHRLDFS
jgi:hypothetical protein